MDQLAAVTTAVTSIVALIASMLGTFIAVDQITVAARRRRFAQFVKEALEVEGPGESPQAKILRSLHRDAVARMVAQSAVPSWRILISLLSAAVSVVFSVLAGIVLIDVFIHPTWWLIVLVFVSFSAGTAAIGWLYLLSSLRERSRIADCFLLGATPLELKFEWSKTGNFRLLRGERLGVGVGVSSIALFMGVGASFQDPSSWAAAVILTLGLLGSLVFGWAARQYTRRAFGSWRHPMTDLSNLPTTSPTPATPSSPSSEGVVVEIELAAGSQQD